MATKIRGRQIETDDFIRSLANANVDWANDTETASLAAIYGLLSEAGVVERITEEQYMALQTKGRKTIYAVTDDTDRLIKIYIGSTLIAKADESQNYAFTYTFPIIFRS